LKGSIIKAFPVANPDLFVTVSITKRKVNYDYLWCWNFELAKKRAFSSKIN
jgi:hypothetical protein